MVRGDKSPPRDTGFDKDTDPYRCLDFVEAVQKDCGVKGFHPAEMKDQEKSSLPFSSMAQLITQLPEEERIVLTLFYLKSESTEMIAKRLGVPQRAVDSVLVSGRARLLASLGLHATEGAHDHAQDGKQE